MKYRLEVHRSLTKQITEAQKAGGLDLYLPLTTRYGVPLAASFMVSEHTVTQPITSSSQLLLECLSLTHENSRTSTAKPGGVLTARREHVHPASPEHNVEVATRRIEYALPVPGDLRRVLLIAFSTAGDGDVDSDFTKALAELFDSSVMTFRWTKNGQDWTPPTQHPGATAQ